jgi:uncharacterized protein YcfJ
MTKPLAIAIAAAVIGGGAFAAFQATRGDYAEVIRVEPIVEPVELVAEVVEASPVVQTVSGTREVCEDKVQHYSTPTRDPNRVTGTVLGAVVGAAVGNQIGGGSGRRAATAAGAVGGAFAGREIQERQQQNSARGVTRTEQVCRTESAPRDEVVAYDVTYRLEDELGTLRTQRKPGTSVSLGHREQTVGYLVTYRHQEQERTIRLNEDPGRRLPVQDGKVLVPADQG